MQVASAEGPLEALIRSFKDASIRSGVFICKLLRAVGPECVDADLILKGATAEECKLNAK